MVWFLSADVLKAIDGFMIGRNYGKCIAAEIETSKNVEALGLDFVHAHVQEEFFYIRSSGIESGQPGISYTTTLNTWIQRLIEPKEAKMWPWVKVKVRKFLKRSAAK